MKRHNKENKNKFKNMHSSRPKDYYQKIIGTKQKNEQFVMIHYIISLKK